MHFNMHIVSKFLSLRGSSSSIMHYLPRSSVYTSNVTGYLTWASTSVIPNRKAHFGDSGSQCYFGNSKDKFFCMPAVCSSCCNRLWRPKGNHSVRYFSVDKPTIIYRFPYMRYLRVLSRFKIYQTAFTVGLAAFLYRGYVNGDFALQSALYGTFAMTTASCVLAFYSYFAMKFIGQMELLESTGEVKISTMNFLGNRQEKVIQLDTITTIETDPINTPGSMNSLYSKFEYLDENHAECTLYYCPRWGSFPSKERFGVLLGKRSM